MSISDTAISKVLLMNGERIPGIMRVTIDYDVNKTITLVTMTMAIKRDSLKITPGIISFDTVTEPKPR